MSVSAINNYENRNTFSNILTSTIIGGAVGYGAKYNIPLRDREKKDINYRAVVNVSRKDVNTNKANSFKIQKERTAAQDEFIKLVDNKDRIKNPTLTDLAERLGGDSTDLGKMVKAEIKDGMDLNTLMKAIGEKSSDRKVFEAKFGNQEEFAKLSLDDVITKLGGIDAPVAKKVSSIIKTKGDKVKTFEEFARELGENSKEVRELKRVSKLNNAFANENVAVIIRKLGGENAPEAKEFKRIISEVDKASSNVARKLVEACHRDLKGKRYAAPLVIAGAAAGFAAAFVHNIFSHNTEN